MLCTNVMKLEEKEQMKHSFYQECNIRKQKKHRFMKIDAYKH
jgi:hypothetical protein